MNLKPLSRRQALALLLLISLTLGAFGLWQWLFVDLPSLDRLTQNLTVPSTKILARDGRLLYEIADPAGVHHTTLPLNQIPRTLQQATIATEDAGFYSHPGIDFVGIARAVWINFTGGEVLAGGSTLTQQVARNMLLDPQERAERTLTRKLRESILAWRLTQAYSKDQILELYLNQTYYGHLAHGVEAAAQTYFGKSASALSLAEAALLAGLPQSPSLYDPLLYPAAAKERQAVVLDLMVKNNTITAAEAQAALAEPLIFATQAFPIAAPHFVFYVWNLVEQKYGPEVLYSGLVITTTLDLDLTQTAETIANRRLADLAADTDGPAHNATDAALVALDPHTGQVLVMLGSPDYFSERISGAINMALAPRQPGSTLKPFTYALTFSPPPLGGGGGLGAWSPSTMLLDVHSAFITKEGYSYVPMNYDRQFHGPVSVREALARSLNVPAVQALDHIGLERLLRLAGELGLMTLTDADRFGLALTLGGGEVRLLDLVAAYGTLANTGVSVTPFSILHITNAQGHTIERWQPYTAPRVFDERVAYLITDILSDNNARAATFGFNSILQIGRPVAVKTGTTTDYRDNWTVGYTPDLVAGVWVGNADFSQMLDLSGVDGAGPIWHEFMRAALAGKPETEFVPPPGLVRAEVCVPSGLLPTPLCPRTRTDWFLEGHVPTQPDNLYQAFNIDTRTGLLASADAPPEFVSEKIFLVLPPIAQEWARQNSIPQPPLTATTSTTATAALILLSPDPNTVFKISPRLPLASQQIAFSAAPAQAVASITFYLDGATVGTVTTAPYEWWWPLALGTHTLYAEARLLDGTVVRSDSLSFTVVGP